MGPKAVLINRPLARPRATPRARAVHRPSSGLDCSTHVTDVNVQDNAAPWRRIELKRQEEACAVPM